MVLRSILLGYNKTTHGYHCETCETVYVLGNYIRKNETCLVFLTFILHKFFPS
jgi:hypothetical protein